MKTLKANTAWFLVIAGAMIVLYSLVGSLEDPAEPTPWCGGTLFKGDSACWCYEPVRGFGKPARWDKINIPLEECY